MVTFPRTLTLENLKSGLNVACISTASRESYEHVSLSHPLSLCHMLGTIWLTPDSCNKRTLWKNPVVRWFTRGVKNRDFDSSSSSFKMQARHARHQPSFLPDIGKAGIDPSHHHAVTNFHLSMFRSIRTKLLLQPLGRNKTHEKRGMSSVSKWGLFKKNNMIWYPPTGAPHLSKVIKPEVDQRIPPDFPAEIACGLFLRLFFVSGNKSCPSLDMTGYIYVYICIYIYKRLNDIKCIYMRRMFLVFMCPNHFLGWSLPIPTQYLKF